MKSIVQTAIIERIGANEFKVNWQDELITLNVGDVFNLTFNVELEEEVFVKSASILFPELEESKEISLLLDKIDELEQELRLMEVN